MCRGNPCPPGGRCSSLRPKAELVLANKNTMLTSATSNSNNSRQCPLEFSTKKNNNHNSTITTPPSPHHRRKAGFLARSLATRTISFIEYEVERRIAQSSFIRQTPPPNDNSSTSGIATLDRSEIILGEMVGQGGFSQIHAVASIELLQSRNNDHHDDTTKDGNKLRHYIKDSVHNGTNRLVMKHLRNDLLLPSSSTPSQKQQHSVFLHAAVDLVMEAHFLSRLQHSHIIKLRGWAAGGTSCFGNTTTTTTTAGSSLLSQDNDNSYFLLLDRLEETLADRIQTWKAENQNNNDAAVNRKTEDNKVGGKNNNDVIHRLQLKLQLAHQLASALEYLHEKRIVYRDLKVDNIGLVNDGTIIQLFDFGLARELPQECLDNDSVHKEEEELFHMSGVGTRRYCAPEVILREGYNRKVDVYGLALVLYEMMSHNVPFAVMGPESHRVLVAQGGHRPTVPESWPEPLQSLLECGWAAKPSSRPTMKEFKKRLAALLLLMKEQEERKNRNFRWFPEIGNKSCWFHFPKLIRKISGSDHTCCLTSSSSSSSSPMMSMDER